MSDCWVWSTSKEHFEFSFTDNLWATSSLAATKKVKKGDQILLYVGKALEQGKGEFKGIFNVCGEWNENTAGPKWPQEKRYGKIKWKYQVRVEPYLTFTLKFKDAKFLPFIARHKKAGMAVHNLGGGPANGRKPITLADMYALKSHLFWNDKKNNPNRY